jgi:hypothetical protein
MDTFGRIFQNVVVPIIGVVGILHETFISHIDRPGLLVLYGAMIGLPAFVAQDQKRRK